MTDKLGYTHHVNPDLAAREREHVTATPPPPVGAYTVGCPDCQARPGQWCEAVHTMPRGTLLRDPHHARLNRWLGSAKRTRVDL